jgi:ubiquinone/menaquinone biosynthesis C-methylase UbiE
MNKMDEYTQGDPYHVEYQLMQPFHQRRLRLTLALINDNCTFRAKVLDIGCGEGHITDAIRRIHGVDFVCGVDYSTIAVKKAARKYPLINFCVTDAYRLPFFDGFFDIAVCNNIWEHVPDPLNLLNDVTRVLSPNGYLLVSTPSLFRYNNLLRIIRGMGPHKMSVHHLTEYTVGQVIDQLTYGGYEVLQIKSYPLPVQGQNYFFTIVHRILKSLLSFCFKLYHSEQSLESTVFFLSRKLNQAK